MKIDCVINFVIKILEYSLFKFLVSLCQFFESFVVRTVPPFSPFTLPANKPFPYPCSPLRSLTGNGSGSCQMGPWPGFKVQLRSSRTKVYCRSTRATSGGWTWRGSGRYCVGSCGLSDRFFGDGVVLIVRYTATESELHANSLHAAVPCPVLVTTTMCPNTPK